MDTDRHGYCEHNRRDHKCWECQAQRARAAELRVAELEGELTSSRAESERLRSAQGRHEAELNAQQVSYAAKVERLTDERDEAFEQVHMLRAACESMEGA